MLIITREMCSHIDMQTHAGRILPHPIVKILTWGLGFDLWP